MKASLPFKYIIADKKGKNYVVFDFKDDSGKRKRKWVTTDLPADCSYKALTAKVNVIVAKFYEEFLTGSLTKVKEAPKERKRQNSARRASVMMLNARQVLSSRHFLITGLKRSNRHSPEPLIRATLAISPGSKTILTSVIRIFFSAT